MRRAQNAVAPATEEINISGVHAPIEVRRHPNARRMTLRVSRTRRAVIVTLPLQCDINQVDSFLNSHIAWVQKHLGKLPMPVAFADGVLVPLRGEPHKLIFVADALRGTGIVNIRPTVDGISDITVKGDQDSAPGRLRRWLVEEVRADLDRCVQAHARKLDLRPRKIAVRDQSTRWGSCSTTGTLSFSWRLIMAPPFVLDYVAAHEVAHLAEMNHGPKFWALVRKTMPRSEEARHWLSVYGMDLHRFGA